VRSVIREYMFFSLLPCMRSIGRPCFVHLQGISPPADEKAAAAFAGALCKATGAKMMMQ
jgi:hypothetical protein